MQEISDAIDGGAQDMRMLIQLGSLDPEVELVTQGPNGPLSEAQVRQYAESDLNAAGFDRITIREWDDRAAHEMPTLLYHGAWVEIFLKFADGPEILRRPA